MNLDQYEWWPYRYVDLSAQQIEERRVLLDRYGYAAYASPLVVMGLTYAYRRYKQSGNTEAVKLSERPLNTPPTFSEVTVRRVSWILDQPLSAEFGSVRTHLLGLLYGAWLLFLAVHNTGDDYLHVTKRFGHIAISQLPFQYTMAIKNWRSPVQLATGLSHETLNPYHRLFGRIIHLFMIAHAALYMNFFIEADLLQKRLQNWDVRTGLIQFWLFNALFILAIPPVRKHKYFALFYKPHAILSGVVLPVLFFHVPYTRKYVVHMVMAWAFNGVSRTNSTTVPVLSSVVPIEGTNLLKIRVPGPAWGVPPLMGSGTPGWIPGQHCYVKQSVAPTQPRSPFSIVSLPPKAAQEGGHESSNIDLVVRNLGGPMTGWLASKAEKNDFAKKTTDRNVHLLVEGPYGECKDFVPELLEQGEFAGSVMLVAGGIGATFTLPIYLALLDRRETTNNVHFFWFVQKLEDASWGLEMINKLVKTSKVDVKIIVTKESKKTITEKESRMKLKVFDGVEILETGKRPGMKSIVDSVFDKDFSPDVEKTTKTSAKNHSRVNVLSCGPPSMMRAVRKAVGTHVLGYGRDVMFHEESFGMGV